MFKDMNLLYFGSKNGFACEKIFYDLSHFFSDLNITRLPAIRKLKINLYQGYFLKNSIVLFAIDSEKELKSLFLYKDILSNTNIVLILPNIKEMFHIGARLYPRFMTDFDNAPFEISSVLYKLIGKCKLCQ